MNHRREIPEQDSKFDPILNIEHTIEIPCLWLRQKSAKNGQIYYVSPSGQVLCSINDLNAYLKAPLTCKCSLKEDYEFEKVFNFDPNIVCKTIHVSDLDKSPCERWIKNTFKDDAAFELYMNKCFRYLIDQNMDRVDMFLAYQRRKYQSKIEPNNTKDIGCQNDEKHEDSSENYKKIKRKQLIDQALQDYRKWFESFDIETIKLTKNGWLLARDFQPRFIRHLAFEFSSSGLIHINSFPQFEINHYVPSLKLEELSKQNGWNTLQLKRAEGNVQHKKIYICYQRYIKFLILSAISMKYHADKQLLQFEFDTRPPFFISLSIMDSPESVDWSTVTLEWLQANFDELVEFPDEPPSNRLLESFDDSDDEYDLHEYFNDYKQRSKRIKRNPYLHCKQVSSCQKSQEIRMVELIDQYDRSNKFCLGEKNSKGKPRMIDKVLPMLKLASKPKIIEEEKCLQIPIYMLEDHPDGSIPIFDEDYSQSESELEDKDVTPDSPNPMQNELRTDDHGDENENRDNSNSDQTSIKLPFEIDDCYQSEEEYSNGEEYEFTLESKEALKPVKNLPEAVAISDPSRFQRNFSEKIHQETNHHHQLKYIKRMKRLKRELEIQGMPGELRLEEKIRLSPPPPSLSPEERVFRANDIVWGPFGNVRFWPGKLLQPKETGHGDKMLMVQWFGTNKQVTTIHVDSLRTLTEGLEAHHCARKRHRNGKRVNVSLELAIQEAMNEFDNSNLKCLPENNV